MKKYVYSFSKIMYYSDTTQQIVIDVCDSMNNGDYDDLGECINDTLDNSLIYYKDQWDVLQDFCTPAEADWNYAIEELYNLVYSAISEEEDDEEDEEEEDE